MCSVQKPYPPIWMAANSDSAVERTARSGYPWLMNPHARMDTLVEQMTVYRGILAGLGKLLPEDMPLMRELRIGRTVDEAVEECRPFLGGKYEVYAQWGQDRVLPGKENFQVPFDKLNQGRFIIGGPQECANEIRRCRDLLGANWLIFRIQWPGMDSSYVLKEIKLLGEQVLPEFK